MVKPMGNFACKRLVSVISALLAMIVIFGMIPQNVVAANKTIRYSANPMNGPAVLDEINRDRTSGGGFYVDSNNVNHYVDKLVET